MPLDDRFDYVWVDRLVFVDGDVAESDHLPEPSGELAVENSPLLQQRKDFRCRVWEMMAVLHYDMCRQVDSRLNGSLEIEDRNVIYVDGEEACPLSIVDFRDSIQTTIDDSELGHHYVTVDQRRSFLEGPVPLRGAQSSNPRTC